MGRGWKAGGCGDGDGQLMEEWGEVSGGWAQHARPEHLMCVSLHILAVTFTPYGVESLYLP